MKIKVDKSQKTPLYKQIAEQIQEQITSGEIPDGFQFPSERQLAEALGINRTTVLNAYKELKADGLLASHVGRGTIAVKGENEGFSRILAPQKPIWEYLFSDYMKNREDFDINKYLEIANQENVISFAAGIASFENFPLEAFQDIEAEALACPKDLMVSPVTGFYSLRKAISTYMQKNSCFCPPSETMVLSGSQQGIDLCARAFLNPGDIVVIEEPSFFPAIRSFRSAGAKIMTVPMEADGMSVDRLEQLLSRYQPKFIYTMPVYHNPSGVSMSMSKRIRLLQLAGKYGVPVLEDDPYSELYYEGEKIAPLKSMDQNGTVIYLSSFSKTISPGLRLGWMCADKKLIEQLANIRQLVDLHANCMAQQIARRFITSGGMELYLHKIRKEYRERRDLMASALSRYAPPQMAWNIPAGGYYLWCSLPPGLSAALLAPEAARCGISILPGMPAYLTKYKGESYIRLNFTYPPKRKITEGIKTLCEVIKKLILTQGSSQSLTIDEINPIL